MMGEGCCRGHRLEEHPDVAAGNLIDPLLDQQDDCPMLLAALPKRPETVTITSSSRPGPGFIGIFGE